MSELDDLQQSINGLTAMLRQACMAYAKTSEAFYRAFYGEWNSYEDCETGQCEHCQSSKQKLEELTANVT